MKSFRRRILLLKFDFKLDFRHVLHVFEFSIDRNDRKTEKRVLLLKKNTHHLSLSHKRADSQWWTINFAIVSTSPFTISESTFKRRSIIQILYLIHINVWKFAPDTLCEPFLPHCHLSTRATTKNSQSFSEISPCFLNIFLRFSWVQMRLNPTTSIRFWFRVVHFFRRLRLSFTNGVFSFLSRPFSFMPSTISGRAHKGNSIAPGQEAA